MEKRDSVLNTDRYDRRRFQQILNMSERLQEMETKGQKGFPTFRPLMADIWAGLYKMKPTLLTEEEYDQNYQINHDFMTKIMNEEGFMAARNATRLDDLSAALGTVRFSEKIFEWIEEKCQSNEKLQKAMEEALHTQQSLSQAQQKQKEAQNELEHANEMGDKEAQTIAKRKDIKAKKEEQKANEQLKQAMKLIQKEISHSLHQHTKPFNQTLQAANAETNHAREDLINLLSGGGAGNGEGELQKLPLREQIHLAELLSKNEKLKKIAEWAGRFKAIARKKQKSKFTETMERSGVTLGVNIERLLPSELAAYKNPITKLDFLRRYAENQTMVYAPEGKETLGKGPITLCLDQSSSMKNLDAQSKGFALALMMIAKKQRRDFAIIPFSSATKCSKLFYEKGKIKPSDLTELAQLFLSGGTSYLPPLEAAVSIIEKQKRYSKADIVFVTDGKPQDFPGVETYCMENGEFQRKKKKRGFNVITVLIGNQVSEQYVIPFSDKIVKASDFNHDKIAETVFTI